MSNVKFTEQCVWSTTQASPNRTYVIHTSKTTTNNPKYAPKCSQKLCDISYDNNKITINMSGGKTVCIPVNIRNNCPPISVTVPNNTFSVVDSINSECSSDSVEPNNAIINDSHPRWDIITETRTCVLGYLLDGNPNTNGPVGDIGGCVDGCGGCFGCSGGISNPCAPPCPRECGYGNCGESGDASRPWSVYINGIRVNFPLATSNETANALLNSEWESNMRQSYANIAACRSTIPGNISQPPPNTIRSYSVSDIVEGIVPGSCEFKLGRISYNAIMYRGAESGPQERTTKVTVKVAYYTYSYRRPKNIQDFLKTEEISRKCNERASQCSHSLMRITSNYNTESCNNTPTCYDTNVDRCRKEQYCCKVNKTEFL